MERMDSPGGETPAGTDVLPGTRMMGYPEVTPELGHWLAGFLDGEGCFSIQRPYGGKRFSCRMSVNLRQDDQPLLVEIHALTGLGRLCFKPSSKFHKGNPQIGWTVSSRADCAHLVEILDIYRLRSKKARDYEIWRTAVRELLSVKDLETYDWGYLRELHERITEVRKFVAVPTTVLWRPRYTFPANECKTVEKLWDEGKSTKEIQRIMGWDLKHPDRRIAHLRERGYNLPSRRSPREIPGL